jgi:hypothetical protein
MVKTDRLNKEGWKVEHGERTAEPDNSYGFLEGMDYNSHEAPPHIQDSDSRDVIPMSSRSSL